jgi:hypothetical protein
MSQINPTVKELLIAALVEKGFDGLCNPYLECGCSIDDLCPCIDRIDGCDVNECIAGVGTATRKR